MHSGGRLSLASVPLNADCSNGSDSGRDDDDGDDDGKEKRKNKMILSYPTLDRRLHRHRHRYRCPALPTHSALNLGDAPQTLQQRQRKGRVEDIWPVHHDSDRYSRRPLRR